MAKKKSKRAEEIPAIYVGLDTTKCGTDKCIVLDKHNQLFKFDSTQACHIVEQGIAHKWANWEAFYKWSVDSMADMCALHHRVFKENPKTGDNVLMVSLYTWKKMLMMCADRTEEGNPINQREDGSGATLKRKTMTRRYFIGESGRDTAKVCLIKTPQARACFLMLRDAIDARVQAGQPAEITEEDMRAVVTTRAAELHTRQDPWRIFQYYRPTLLQDKLIRHD